MIILFVITTVVLVAIALTFVLWPLWRNRRFTTRPRTVTLLGIILLLGIPLASTSLYLYFGNPATLNPHPTTAPLTLSQALVKLKKQLNEHPDDPTLWSWLGQVYSAKKQPAKARDAYGKALALHPDDPNLLVAWAQEDSLTQPGHRIVGEARIRLKHALDVDPKHQRALWMLGISDFQLGQYAAASTTWQRLLSLLKPGSKVAKAVHAQIIMAEQRGGLPLTQAPAMTASPQLKVEVSLAPELAAKLRPGATLFVFARQPHGSPVPLAVSREPVNKFPVSITLSNAMSMLPKQNLSSSKTVEITARISFSGRALPASGDLQGHSVLVSTQRRQPVSILIDQVVRK